MMTAAVSAAATAAAAAAAKVAAAAASPYNIAEAAEIASGTESITAWQQLQAQLGLQRLQRWRYQEEEQQEQHQQ